MVRALKQLAMPLVCTVLLVFILMWLLESGQSTRATIQDIVERYEPTTGTVNSARVKTNQKSGRRNPNTYEPLVEYRYSVDGRVRRSTRYTVGLDDTWDKNTVEQLLLPIRPGTKWEIYYDPENPANAVFVLPDLNRYQHTHWQWIFLVGLGLVIALVWLGITIRHTVIQWRSKGS